MLTEQRRAELNAAVAEAFEAAYGPHSSPRIHADIRTAGMGGEREDRGEVDGSARTRGATQETTQELIRPDKRAGPFADLVNRDFTAPVPNVTWVGDMTEIPTGEGKFYLSMAIDLSPAGYSDTPPVVTRTPNGWSDHQDGRRRAWREGAGDRGDFSLRPRFRTYAAQDFTTLCHNLDIRQSMGRTGLFRQRGAESFVSTLEREVLSRNHFKTRG